MDKDKKVVWITKTRSLGPTVTNSLNWISLFNGDLPEWLKFKIIEKPRALNTTMLALDNLEKYKKYLKHNKNQKQYNHENN